MAASDPGAREPSTQITISIDPDLRRIGDERLALYWHVAQANPASIDDQAAGELAMRIGWEIIRRWLRGVEPPLDGGRCRQCTSGVDDSHAITPSSPTRPRCGAPGHTVYRTTDVTCPACLDILAEPTAAQLPQREQLCTEHLMMLDDAGRCVLCAGEIGDCPNCGGRHRPPWCADPSEAPRYGDSELDGDACCACHREFLGAEARVPATAVDGGPQLYAHPDCVTPSITTEPPEGTP